MVPVDGYSFERGDVLLSVQLILTREEQRADPQRVVFSHEIAGPRGTGGWLPTAWGAQEGSVVPFDPAGRSARLASGGPGSASTFTSTGDAQPQELGLIDPSTGDGTGREYPGRIRPLLLPGQGELHREKDVAALEAISMDRNHPPWCRPRPGSG